MYHFVSPLTATIAFLILSIFPWCVSAQTLSEQLAAESIEKIAADVRQRGDAVRGAILFAQQKLQCAGCHASRDASSLGPALGRSEEELSDVQVVEAILFPSKRIRKGFETHSVLTKDGRSFVGIIIKQDGDTMVLRDNSDKRRTHRISLGDIEQQVKQDVSLMPDKLANQLNSRSQFLDLARYVVELMSSEFVPSEVIGGGQSISTELLGRAWINEFRCEACHENDIGQSLVSEAQAPKLQWFAGRVSPNYLRRFINDPHGTRPDTVMPNVLNSMGESDKTSTVESLVHYLVSLAQVPFRIQKVDPERSESGRQLFASVGCAACHLPREANDEAVTRFESVSLDHVPEKFSLESLTEYLEDPHQGRPHGRMPNMKLTHWEALDLASYLIEKQRPTGGVEDFVVDASLAAVGKRAFRELACNGCHDVDAGVLSEPGKSMSQLRDGQGCLSEENGRWPKYSLSAEQRSAIADALREGGKTLADDEQIDLSLTTLRCVNCHRRGELGGVSDKNDAYFQTSNPNLGPQGRIPPHLTNVGAKLNRPWLRRVLISGKSIRPYMLTRMPQFGAQNVEHLIELFANTDEQPAVSFPTFQDQKEMRTAGAEMVGSKGLNCVACHTFQMKQAATMPAVDLTEMAERLQKNWFYHYMKDPQRQSPNTVMPSFWPGGKSIRDDFFEGDPDLQVEAIWQYLLDGRQARQPRGLVIEPIELIATDEAVMLRRKYPDVGKRGIGVGYPGQVNQVFDAEQLRLAQLWQGKFADPGGVWRSQGHGAVRPLSRNVIRFVPGPDIDHIDSPWVVDEGRPPLHRFHGYELDDQRRPAFLYTFDGVMVRDYCVDQLDPETKRSYLRRTLSLRSENAHDRVRIRAASGKEIVARSESVFVVDGQLAVTVPPNAKVVSEPEDRVSLQFPVSATTNESSFTIEYRWIHSTP